MVISWLMMVGTASFARALDTGMVSNSALLLFMDGIHLPSTYRVHVCQGKME